MRVNSECLYCTGQAVESLLDDPDFMKDLNMNNEEQENIGEEDVSNNEDRLNMISRINYDQYEI